VTVVGYDYDGTIQHFVEQPPGVQVVIITGRTWAEYDEALRAWAQRFPVYIRGTGDMGDMTDAAYFKAQIINAVLVDTYYEDHEYTVQYLRENCGSCTVVKV
jgi:hypothetical protein